VVEFDLILTIDGVPYDLAARNEALLEVSSWGWDLEGDAFLEFAELCPDGSLVGRWNGSHDVSLAVVIDAVETVVFAGRISSRQPFFADQGMGYGYQALGFKYLLNQVPIVAIDGTNAMLFNVSPIESEDYIEADAGLTVGEILAAVLDQHAAALAAIGVAADSTTDGQLDALTLVPNDAVAVSGSRLGQALETVLQKWARNHVMYITPAGKLRFHDVTTGTPLALTYGDDPITYPLFTRDWKDCATRVQVVGQGRIFPAYVSLLGGELEAAWDGTQQDLWTWAAYATPGDAYVEGTVISVDGPTSVTVEADDPDVSWVENFWNARKAWAYMVNGAGSAITYQEARPLTACSALAPGGTATLTFAFDLENAGSGAYDTFRIIGNPAALGDGGLNDVWRLFNIVDPGGLIGGHLVSRFPTAVAFIGYNGTSSQETYFPQALVIVGGVTIPMTFKILPSTGQVLFDQPICASYTSQQDMDTGGEAVESPDDLYMLLAYSRGALTATWPPDVASVPQYEGTAYTEDGLERTHTITMDSWVYAGNQAQMEALAEMYLDSMKDAVVTGGLLHHGMLEEALAPGILLSVSSVSGTTGYESLGVPVRGAKFALIDDGRSLPQVQLRCSNRRNPRTGDRYYAHPTSFGQAAFKMDFGPGLDYSKLAGRLPDYLTGVDTSGGQEPS
jgi:hypothetical protein